MKIRPSVAIIEKNHLLVMRYHYSGQDVYQLPGGNVEGIDTLEETIVRELQEELLVEIEVGPLLLCGQTINIAKHQSILHTVFSGKIIKGKPALNSEHTSALEVLWLPLDLLDKINMYPNAGKFLKINPVTCQYVGVIEQNWF